MEQSQHEKRVQTICLMILAMLALGTYIIFSASEGLNL